MGASTIDESYLIRELKTGSEAAFARIYNMYAPRLYAYCIKYAKLQEKSEEIVEDVFIWLWNHRQEIRNENSLKSLLFTCSKHYLINAWRSTVNSKTYEDFVNFRDKLSNDVDSRPLEYEDFYRLIKHEISKLPSTQQKVIQLSRFEQMRNKDIAQQLNLSEQTVKNQLSTGLKTLRENLIKNKELWALLTFYINFIWYFE